MNNLPNLSEWHEVPRGVTIPVGTMCAVVYSDGVVSIHFRGLDTGDYSSETKFYTAEPIERTLAQVIEAAYNSGDWESAAQAAQDFLAPKESEYVIDNDRWILNDEGTYNLPGLDFYSGKTLDYIRTHFGIQEDRRG